MKVETGTIDGRRKNKKGVGHGSNVERIARKKPYSKLRFRVEAPSVPIQRLFNTCKLVFKGPGTVPSPLDVQNLQNLLDKMRAEDVGLRKEVSFFSATSDVGTPRINCTTIHKCHNFMMCIFFLPANAVIPLHNHPGMTVFSKLLLGSMRIKAYDLVEDQRVPPPAASDGTTNSSSTSHCSKQQVVRRLARLEVDGEFTAPCNTSVLYPTTGGNIHTFTAITPCAILDIMGPPYSEEDGRDCTYYKDYPFSPNSDEDTEFQNSTDAVETTMQKYGWLEETEIAQEEKNIYEVEYCGPSVIDS